MRKTAKCKITKRQNGRKSRTVNMRTGRAQRVGETKKISKSPSIIPEIPKPELYMLNEAEFIRTFGWWGLH